MVVRVATTGVADAWIVGRFLRARSGVSTTSMSFRFFWDWVGLVIVTIVFVVCAVSIVSIVAPEAYGANLLVYFDRVERASTRCDHSTVASLGQYCNPRSTSSSNSAGTLDTNLISQHSAKTV